MPPSGTAALPSVATPTIEGVSLARHPLQTEAQRSLGVARRLGRRLMRWLKVTDKETTELERIVGRDPETGRNITEQVLSDDGKPIIVPILPDEEFRKTWELYERTVRYLLVEQRARASMGDGKGGPPMSDAAFEAQIRELAQRAVLEMPRAELDALLKQRRIDIAANASAVPERAKTSDTPASEDNGSASTVPEAANPASGAPEQDGNGGFLHFGGDDE